MIKKKFLFIISIFLLLNACSIVDKTGVWNGSEDEERQILELEKEQNQIVNKRTIYASEDIYSKEVILKKSINLSKPKKNKFWEMSSFNHQNSIGHLYLSGVDNLFLKKKFGKNKFDIAKVLSSPVIVNNNIIFSDDKGTIFNITQSGQLNWKKNIYKKVYKKIYKNLNFAIKKDKIYVSDNIGLIYSLSLQSGDLIWIKNHSIPFKSNIKIFNNKILLINQDNRILSFSTKDGSKIWDIRTITSFIKMQDNLSLAVSKLGNIFSINSAGDLIKANINNGKIIWSLKIPGSTFDDVNDLFSSSGIVITNEDIIFSASSYIYSFNSKNGILNWQQKVTSVNAPLVDGKYIFSVTNNGYFVILKKDSGEIISSTNILKVLKEKKRKTKVVSFIMGSGKIYSVTSNGYLISSSASSGKVEYYKKIGDPVITDPIILDGKLFILSENSRLFVFN